MKVFHDPAGARRALGGPPVVALGVFDGVHLGHQRILRAALEAAAEAGGIALPLTFDPHPDLVLRGEAPPLLTSTDHKVLWFERLGLEAALVLTFDERFASTEAGPFVRDLLAGSLGARHVVLGRTARFGRGAKGDLALLQREGAEAGLAVTGIELVQAGGRTASSTAVRAAVEAGDLGAAREMLGRPYALFGRVALGEGRGRKLGFPTANLEVRGLCLPPPGVYRGRAQLHGGRRGAAGGPAESAGGPAFSAAVNVGRRPTFGGGAIFVEAHLLDFSGDLADCRLELSFLKRLRPEERFDSPESLRAQIARDIARIRGGEAAGGGA